MVVFLLLGGKVKLIGRQAASLALIVVAGDITAAAGAEQYPTIVGSWYLPEYGQADCQSHQGLHIKPMSLLNDETACEFTDVSREGWKVTWHGKCNFSGESAEGVTVTAVETDGALSLQFDDGDAADGFLRCPVNDAVSTTLPSDEAAVDRVALSYTAYPASSERARAYWSDEIDEVASLDPPPVVPVTVQVAEAGPYTFAFITGGMICGMGNHGCPVRIFSGQKELGEFSACEDLSKHAVSADFTRFFACEAKGEGRLLKALIN